MSLKSLTLTVLFAFVLGLGACATTHTTKEPPATPVVKAGTKKKRPVGYPHCCYCIAVDEYTGLLVGGDGRVSMGPVMCRPDKEDLARRDTFCLPVKDASKGIQVENGRIKLHQPGHTHNVRRRGVVWCKLQARK